MSLITKRFPVDVTVSEGERAVTAIINTAAMDRDNEVVLPMGCDAKEYEANPVVFFQHDHYSMPVGKCVSLVREADKLTAKMVFAERPATHPEAVEWLPDTLLSLYQQGVMNAFSIGFTVSEARQPTKKDMETYGGEVRRVISKWKMFEFSCVTLPANQDAVAMAVSKAFETSAEARQHEAPADTHDPEPLILPKRYVYLISDAAPAPDVSTIAKMVTDGIAKARGRIYTV